MARSLAYKYCKSLMTNCDYYKELEIKNKKWEKIRG
jgi:hypothetical protein